LSRSGGAGEASPFTYYRGARCRWPATWPPAWRSPDGDNGFTGRTARGWSVPPSPDTRARIRNSPPDQTWKSVRARDEEPRAEGFESTDAGEERKVTDKAAAKRGGNRDSMQGRAKLTASWTAGRARRRPDAAGFTVKDLLPRKTEPRRPPGADQRPDRHATGGRENDRRTCSRSSSRDMAARSSGRAASAPAAGSSCCSDATPPTRCFFKSKRRGRLC